MNRSRQQTRHRTFGWYAGDPVAHNYTVRMGKRLRKRANAFMAFRRAILVAGSGFAAIGIAAADVAAFRDTVASAVALGMDLQEARDQVTHYRKTTAMTWPRIESVVTRNAINSAFYQSGPDHE